MFPFPKLFFRQWFSTSYVCLLPTCPCFFNCSPFVTCASFQVVFICYRVLSQTYIVQFICFAIVSLASLKLALFNSICFSNCFFPFSNLHFSFAFVFCICHFCFSPSCIYQSHFFALVLLFSSSWKYSRTSAIRRDKISWEEQPRRAAERLERGKIQEARREAQLPREAQAEIQKGCGGIREPCRETMCWARKSPSLIVNTGGYQPQKCPDEIHTAGTWAGRYVPHSILPQTYAFGSWQCGWRITPNTGCINFQPKIFLGQICHIHASFT